MPANGVLPKFHIYNKGIDDKVIFVDDQDYLVFQGYLKDYLSAPIHPSEAKKTFTVKGRTFQGTPHQPKNYLNQIELIAYGLSPNRFDLLVQQTVEGSLEKFIRSLCTRYSMYFNRKYKRSGSLFDGPYKMSEPDSDKSLDLVSTFHSKSKHSSSEVYSGRKSSGWIKPLAIPGDYKVKSVAPLERKDLTSIPKRKQRRFPEFLSLTIGLLILVSLGMGNIKTTEINRKVYAVNEKPDMEISNVLGTYEAVASPSASPTVSSATPTPEPNLNVSINITDGSPFVNIRQKPTMVSEKVGEAKDGDVFEFISKVSGFYEIKLVDGSVGFISGKYIDKKGEGN